MRRFAPLWTAWIALFGLVGCTASPGPAASPATPAGAVSAGAGATGAGSTRTGASGATAPVPPARLVATRLAVRLPAALSRPVVFAHPDGLLVAGGLTVSQRTTAAVLRVDLAGSQVVPAGTLATPVHDAAGARVGDRDVIFGGGTGASLATVQALVPGAASVLVGHLPQARSDLVATATGGVAYLLGGYTGGGFSPTVLGTSDGVTFSTVATLPVPVRYPALLATATALWLVGGVLANGTGSDAVQRVDLATGTAVVVARLPRALSHAAGFVLAGGLYLAGGVSTRVGASATGRPSADIVRLDPATGATTLAGSLPLALSDAGVAVLGDAAYLVGGETPALLTSIIEIKAAGS